MNEKIVTYEPDNSLKQGYFVIFNEIFSELKSNKWLTYQLFKRDILTIYKQSIVGIMWAFIIPIFSVGTFIILNRSGIFSLGDINVPYPIFAILGMAFWQFFSTGLVSSSNSLVRAGGMIIKINFSKKSLVIASLGQPIISFLVQIVLTLILCVYYGLKPHIFILLIPLFLIPLTLITLGIGFILSLINGIMRDIANVISIIMTFFMFLTPILYARPKMGLLSTLTSYNPIYYLISIPRELILLGSSSELKGYFLSSIVSALIFLICIVIFHLTESRVTERV